MRELSAVRDYRRIEKAILFLEKNFRARPDLKRIAQSVHLSEYHFERLFKRWAGISPKRFVQLLTVEYAKRIMDHSPSLLDVTFRTGLSGPGRLHDLFVNSEAVTPGEFKSRGRTLKIVYGVHPSPFGECLIAATDRGICHVAFLGPVDRRRVIAGLKQQWKNAEISEDPSRTRPSAERLFSTGRSNRALPGLHLRGTNFQISVWRALLRIPRGAAVSYEELARAVARPDAVRAVANAVGRNPVAFLIPCHRVLRKTGAVGGYRWGSARKRAMLAWEAGISESA